LDTHASGMHHARRRTGLVSVLPRRFSVKRIFPRLAVVLSILIFGSSAKAQTGALADGRANPPVAAAPGVDSTSARESLPDLVRRVKPSVVSVLTYDAKSEPLIS